MEQVAEMKESGRDLYGTVDKLSVELREALDVPASSARIVEDMPLVETYGESSEALQYLISGLNARLFDNDFEASNAFYDAAIETDPGFVMAWYAKAVNLVESGDLRPAQEAITQAQKLDYRLPARDQANLKRLQYRLSGQQDKLIAFLRMQVRLNDDATSHNQLAGILMVTGQLEEAKQQYQLALEKDALNVGILLQLSLLERATGNMDAAIAWARRYQEEKPEDFEAQQTLGDLLRDSGDLDAAADHYMQASILADEPVQPLLRLVDIELRKGNITEARNLLGQAEAGAESVAQKAQVREVGAELEARLGRMRAAIEQLRQQGEFLAQFQSPWTVTMAVYQPMIRAYNSLGDPDTAQEILDVSLGRVGPPLDKFLAFSEADILFQREDYDAAEAAALRGAEVIEEFKLEDMNFLVDMIRGYILRKRGDYPGSSAAFKATIKRIERSVLGGSDLYRELPAFNAELAHSLVLGGELDLAEDALTDGFRLDPSNPLLWVNKARFQYASGQPQLAQASVSYALAIWKDADPEYFELNKALALEQEIRRSLTE
jgi:tetratricopeptide (TPR) repeat protein